MDRLVGLFEQAAGDGAELVAFPELALTSFFPHWEVTSEEELLSYYEHQMPHQGVEPLLDASQRHGVAVTFGYAEAAPERRLFNTASVFEGREELLRYRKVHLPGYRSVQPGMPFQNLEKKYFETGDLSFPVVRWRNTRMGVAICNDRRWPEVYRLLALQGAELVSIGYNTPRHTPGIPEADHLNDFHHRLVMQAGAYQNSLWIISSGKAGTEEGVEQIGGTMIIAPSGQIVAECASLSDEVLIADIDLDMSARYRRHRFNFAMHREPHLYEPIAEPVPEGWPWTVEE